MSLCSSDDRVRRHRHVWTDWAEDAKDTAVHVLNPIACRVSGPVYRLPDGGDGVPVGKEALRQIHDSDAGPAAPLASFPIVA